MREHLDRTDDTTLVEPAAAVRELVTAADDLDAWHRGGRAGSRPPGRLRHHRPARLSRLGRTWAAVPYRVLYDPDGRPRRLRRAGTW